MNNSINSVSPWRYVNESLNCINEYLERLHKNNGCLRVYDKVEII